MGKPAWPLHLVMDRAYEGQETRQLALDLGFIPVVPPKSNRLTAWEYDREMYKRRNQIERLFRRLKGFRRIFSRFDKLDVMFLAFIRFALIVRGTPVVLTGPSCLAHGILDAPSRVNGCAPEITIRLGGGDTGSAE